MESSNSLPSSQETSSQETMCKRRKRTCLTTGKKFHRHLSSQKIVEADLSTSSLSSSVESCTQVMPLKVKASGNQTTVGKTCSSATSTVESVSEEICIQTGDNNLLIKTEGLPLSIRDMIMNGTFEQLCSKLDSQGQLNDFSSLLANIANRKIRTENICWLLNLHLGELMSLDSTTQMQWHKDIVDFIFNYLHTVWSIHYQCSAWSHALQ